MAEKMAEHHRTRARQRVDARQKLHEKAQAQVSLCLGRCYLAPKAVRSGCELIEHKQRNFWTQTRKEKKISKLRIVLV